MPIQPRFSVTVCESYMDNSARRYKCQYQEFSNLNALQDMLCATNVSFSHDNWDINGYYFTQDKEERITSFHLNSISVSQQINLYSKLYKNSSLKISISRVSKPSNCNPRKITHGGNPCPPCPKT